MSDLTNVEVSLEEFQTNKEVVIDVLQQRDPDLDLSDGSALTGLVIENEAQMAAVHSGNYDRLNKSFSLQAISENLVDVDDDFVDSLVSNYFITRRDATPATGPVRVIVNLDVTYVLPSGFAFSSGSVTYATTEPVRVLRSGSQADQTSNQRVLIARSDGRFEFTVDAQASVEGSAGSLAAGTALTIVNPIDGMESASAATDFTGGEDRETNAELLARAQAGITAKTLAGPEHIQAALEELFPGILTSTLGIGSPLMTRDRANVFGISTGATEDIWVKTTAFPLTTEVEVTATATGARTLSFELNGDDANGVYRVVAIRRADIAGVDGDAPDSVGLVKRSNLVFDPKTPLVTDLNYGSIADIRVTFTDTSSGDDYTVGDDGQYVVQVLKMPSVGAVGNYVYDPSVRPAGTDFYVRGGVPCLVDVAVEIRIPAGAVAPDTETVQDAVAAAINAFDFGTSSLGIYTVHKAISEVLDRGTVASVELSGIIYAPDLSSVVIPPTSTITISEDLSRGYSPDNTVFTCPPDNVGVTIVSE